MYTFALYFYSSTLLGKYIFIDSKKINASFTLSELSEILKVKINKVDYRLISLQTKLNELYLLNTQEKIWYFQIINFSQMTLISNSHRTNGK